MRDFSGTKTDENHSLVSNRDGVSHGEAPYRRDSPNSRPFKTLALEKLAMSLRIHDDPSIWSEFGYGDRKTAPAREKKIETKFCAAADALHGAYRRCAKAHQEPIAQFREITRN